MVIAVTKITAITFFISNEEFREMALSFPETTEAPHFDRSAFKITKKRIFATLHEQSNTANLKLPLQDQTVFCSMDEASVYPVPNKWGLQGWTTFVLRNVPSHLMLNALDTAYKDALRKK